MPSLRFGRLYFATFRYAQRQNMSWAGLEPATNGLRGRCSTIELPAHLENLDFKKFEGRFSDVPYERSELRDL